MNARVCKVAVLVCVVLTICIPAWPQVAGTASLSGVVTDPTGAVIPGTEVKATHEGTGVERTIKTDATGKFLFSQLPPGKYKVEIRMEGFRSVIHQHVELLVGTSSNLDVALEVGTLAEEVVVEGAVTGLNTTDASLGTPFSGEEVSKLPSLDLNPVALLSLQPGVTFVPGQTDGVGGYSGTNDADHRGGSVSGSRSDQTNVTLDGVDVNDPVNGTAFFSVLRVTQASLQEFRVSTTTYSSEGGGRSSAAQVSLVTKSGTNDLHGSAYYLHRNEALNANDFFLNRAGEKEGKFRRHLYGASLGGPVVKNRFFLFGNWERLEESIFQAAERSVPSLAMRDGVFIYPCDDVAGFAACPAGATQVAGVSGNLYNVPAGQFGLSPAQIDALDRGGPGVSAASLAAWASLPEPNSTGFSDGINLVGFRFAAPVGNIFNTFIARADINIDRAAKHTVFWRGTIQADRQSSAPQFPGGDPFQKVLIANKGFATGYTAVFSPTTVNTFRWGLTRVKDSTSGIRGSEFVRHRFLDDTLGFFNQNDGTSSSLGRTIPQHHFRNDFNWTRGKHTFTFGGEARYTRNNGFRDSGSFHFIVINPSWLPDGAGEIQPGHTNCGTARPECAALPFAVGRIRDNLSLLIAPLSQVTANYNFDRTGATLPDGAAVRRRFAVDEYEFYAQDQWRITPTITLNYGLRYYYASPPWETNGNQVVPSPRISDWFDCRQEAMLTGQASRLACGNLDMVLGGKVNNGRPYYDADKNNFSPRIGVAWAPRSLGWFSGDGKMTIRAGYSLVYDRMGNALAVGFDEAGSFGMATSLSNGLGSCSIGGASGRPLCPRFSGYLDTAAGFAGAAAGAGLQSSPGGSFPATPPLGLSGVTNTIDDRLRTPYSHALSFSVAREIPGDMIFEAAWVGRRGLKLPIARDFAMPADLVDPISGMSAFQAARLFIEAAANGVSLDDIGLIAYWENLFPGFGPSGVNQGCLGWGVLGSGCGFSATQVAYDYVMGYHGLDGSPGFGTSTVWEDIDRFQFPAMLNCPAGTDEDGDGFPDCQFAFFPGQFVQLRGLTGIARSEYSALQLSLRKRYSHGLLFNLNYTWSHSLDHASVPERAGTFGSVIGAGYSGFMLNAWDLSQQYADSDFDMRHQFNSHWTYELPVGRGKTWGGGIPGWANQIVGGWSLSGIFRANSGLPLTVINGRTWPTNWNLQGNAVCVPSGSYVLGLATGSCPGTQNVSSALHGGDPATSSPNAFADPDAAFTSFRFGATGESGGRNQMRGDKYVNLDFGIAKSFNLPGEGHRFEFRWDMFNLLNSAYFDTGAINASIGDPGTFGDYTAVLGGPRRMQFTLRWVF